LPAWDIGAMDIFSDWGPAWLSQDLACEFDARNGLIAELHKRHLL
jgi:hypothetical protein